MSHAHGTYLGGVVSVECLRSRSVVDGDTGCWHWRQSTFPCGCPSVRLVGSASKMRGRRAALWLASGGELPLRGHLVWARDGCKSVDCVNPEHATSGTKAQWGRVISKRGVYHEDRARRAASAKRVAVERGITKIPDADLPAIRASEEPSKAVADRYGVHAGTINAIRRGAYRRSSKVGAVSVFAWDGRVQQREDARG